MKKHVYELQDLSPGTTFEVVGLEENYRKLILVAVTQGAAQVKGESSLDDKTVNEDDGTEVLNWRPLGSGTCFSLRTPVRVVEAVK